MGWFNKQSDEDKAVSYLLDGCNEYGGPVPLVRHYPASEAADDFERHAGVRLTDAQSAKVIQRVRDQVQHGSDERLQPAWLCRSIG